MSLVGDALRRARSEGGKHRGVAIPPGLGPPIRRSLLGGPLAIVLALVLVAALAALLTWWLVGGSDDTPATAEAVQATNAGRTGSGRMTAPETVPSPSAPATRDSRPTPQLAGGAPDNPTGSTAPAGDVAAPALPVPTSLQNQGIVETTGVPEPGIAATPVFTPTAEREFVLDAELGYATLHLDYLVYKPSAPFARINGREVIVGSLVQGFKVEEIGPDFVRLSDSRGPLTLRVR